MSLQRQLLIAVTGLFLLLLLGNLIVSMINARNYLQDQLQVHAQDTATSLGLSLSQAAQGKDTATLETLINVIFDRGYYRRISYSNLAGTPPIVREYPIVIENVPAWFVQLIDLPEPHGKAEVVSGWYQLGQVEVVGHPGFAYRDLWQVFKAQLWLFFLFAVLAYIASSVALRYLLNPLKRVEEQAEAICRKDFSSQLVLPKTTELRRVVIAMNRMVNKVADMFREQLDLSETLFRQAHIDANTGLSNRADFDARVGSFLAGDRAGESGILLLVHIDSLHKLNKREGRESGDLCLKAVADILRSELVNSSDAILSRRSGSDFCIFIPLAELAAAKLLVASIYESVERLPWFNQKDGLECYIGATYSNHVHLIQPLLAQADTALREAQLKGPAGVVWYAAEQSGKVSRGSDAWRRLLLDALARRELTFDVQPVFNRDKEVLYLEVLARLEIDGERRPAATFLAMAERLSLTPKVDRLLLELVFDKFAALSSPNLCINLSVLSLRDDQFMQWLNDFLTLNPDFATRLQFELNERAVQVAEMDVRHFIVRMQAFGCPVSLDHVGLNGAALQYLQSLGVTSLKVSHRFVAALDKSTDSQFFVRSLVQIAHSCDALLLVEGVETQACWQHALAIGVDGAQGFYLGKPQPDWREEKL